MPYRIYDHAEKSLVYDTKTGTAQNGFRDMKILELDTLEQAEAWKDESLDSGMYYDRPHTVYEIKEA